jgi:signal transduction histidine kinase
VTLPRTRVVATVLTAGMCAAIFVLTWFGYRATRGWEHGSALLLERRANEAADLLVMALMRDMHAVQRSVLLPADWNAFMQDPPYDVSTIVATAFARYPYPDAFFAARGELTAESLLFFTRSDRPPAWAQLNAVSSRFPVAVLDAPALAARLIAQIGRVEREASSRRDFAVFEFRAAGTEYQAIVHLRHSGLFRERLDGVFGFLVDMTWMRRHYFQQVTSQIATISGAANGLEFAVFDEHGTSVASTLSVASPGSTSRRSFPVMFCDPLLVAVDQPKREFQQEWVVQVVAAADPTLPAAIRSAERTLLLAAAAAGALLLGLMLTSRAVSASYRLTELRSEFVSSVTHELKTPISTIRALGDTLVSGRVSSREGQREYAQLVVQEAKRLTRLVDNLLALSRITDITEVYWFEPLPLDSLVQKSLAGFEQQITTAGFRTHMEIPPDTPLIQVDRTAVGLLLDNLIDNAIRYSPSERSLVFTASWADGVVVLNVSDKGRGIPHDEIHHVTRKFFRGGRQGSNGSGLGLAIVKRIVADHHGALEITSRVDEGTTVSVSFPMAERR